MDNLHKHDHHRARFNQARIASKRQFPGGHMPKAMVTSDGEAKAILSVLKPDPAAAFLGSLEEQLDLLIGELDGVGVTPVNTTDKSIILDDEF